MIFCTLGLCNRKMVSCQFCPELRVLFPHTVVPIFNTQIREMSYRWKKKLCFVFINHAAEFVEMGKELCDYQY